MLEFYYFYTFKLNSGIFNIFLDKCLFYLLYFSIHYCMHAIGFFYFHLWFCFKFVLHIKGCAELTLLGVEQITIRSLNDFLYIGMFVRVRFVRKKILCEWPYRTYTIHSCNICIKHIRNISIGGEWKKKYFLNKLNKSMVLYQI